MNDVCMHTHTHTCMYMSNNMYIYITLFIVSVFHLTIQHIGGCGGCVAGRHLLCDWQSSPVLNDMWGMFVARVINC